MLALLPSRRRHTRPAARLQCTVVVAVPQPSPDTLALADDVMLLSAGRLVLHSPRELVLPFFESQVTPL